MIMTTRCAALLLLTSLSLLAQDAPPGTSVGAKAKADLDPFAFVAGNEILRELQLRSYLGYKPVVVAMQPAAVPDVEREKFVAANCGSWGRALLERLQRDYFQPAGLSAATDRAMLRVLVLTDRNTFELLHAWSGVRDSHDDAAFYAPQLGAAVVLDRGSTLDGKYGTGCVRPLLHVLLHERLDACGKGGDALPLWLVEGLGERLGSHAASVDESEPLGVFDLPSLGKVAALCVDRLDRIAAVRPLAELVAMNTLAALDARTAGLPVNPALPLDGLSHEASLFLAWLDEGEARLPDRGRQLVRAWLALQPGGTLPALPAEPAALEGDFVGWVQEQIVKHRVRVPASVFTLKQELLVPGEIRPGVLVDSADLALPGDAIEVERGRLMLRAARGDLAGAGTLCDELLARSGLDEAEAKALRTDRRLLAALQDLRLRWLAAHLGKTLEFREGSALLRTTLVRMNGELPVVKDKGRERELSASAMLPSALAVQLMAPGNVQKGADDEARSFAWLLAEDRDWKEKTSARLRKDAGPGGLALLEQRADYDAALSLGAAVASLEELAGHKLPLDEASPAEREAWLSLLQQTLAWRSVPLLAARLDVLRALGGRVLRARFDAAPLANLPLKGKLQDLGQGRIRATWSFADAAQLEDWVARPFDDLDLQQPLLAALTPEGLSPEGGWVIARASGQWRCKLAFAAPFTVDYDVRYDFTPGELAGKARGEEPTFSNMVQSVGVRMCTDDYGSGLTCLWQGDLYAVDKRAAIWDHAETTARSALIDVESHIRLEHDGQTLKSIVDGQPAAMLGALKRTSGAFEVWHHTDRPIALRNLVIEGMLDLAGLAPIRDAWVQAALEALGAGH
jgi:hypothetical protein